MVKLKITRLFKILTGLRADGDEEFIPPDGRLERVAHFWVLVIRSFTRNRCFIRASALSYSTLLGLIPLLAVAIGVTSSLLKTQGEDKIYQAINRFVANFVPPESHNTNSLVVSFNLSTGLLSALTGTNAAGAQKQVMLALSNSIAIAAGTNGPATDAPVVSVGAQKAAAKWIREFVENAQSGTLGVTGMILLVAVAITMLNRIEGTFNDIWGVTRGRNWLLQIVLYWTTITLGPLLLTAALALAGGAQFQAAKSFLDRMPLIGSLGFQCLPVVVLWFAFALIYQLVPNTRVKFSAAFAGGMVAGTLWHLNNVFGFLYISRVVSNGKIYGSLGLIPVFMVGLYFSWAILLFGAQFAYAVQNRQAYLQDRLADNVNQRGREFVALRLMSCLGQRFQSGLAPATVPQMSAELGIPSRLTQQVLRTLIGARLVTEVAGTEAAYVPARPLETINAYQILHALRTGAGQELPLLSEPVLAGFYGEFARIEEAERQIATGISMLALIERMPAPATSLAAAGTEPGVISERHADARDGGKT